MSLSLVGRPLPCDCLPATLRVGYNHAPAPMGAVYGAAKAGEVPALQATLDAGGSTEEAEEVCWERHAWGAMKDQVVEGKSLSNTRSSPISSVCRAGALLPTMLLLEATSRPSARFWRQAPTRPQPPR